MRVRCVSNKPQDAQATERYLGKGSGSNLPTFPLTVGKEYVVYAIAAISDNGAYLILDDDQTEGEYSPPRTSSYEPVWYDKNLFEVVDATIDPEWESMKGTMWTKWRGETRSFPEFVRDGKQFYAAILDDEPEALKIFSKYISKYGELSRH